LKLRNPQWKPMLKRTLMIIKSQKNWIWVITARMKTESYVIPKSVPWAESFPEYAPYQAMRNWAEKNARRVRILSICGE
jgi:hypothetical protein